MRSAMVVMMCGAILWVAILLSVLGNIYWTKAIPHGFSDWILDVQVRGIYGPGQEPHSALYYLVRFYVVTVVIVSAGIISAIYLRRHRESDGGSTQSQG